MNDSKRFKPAITGLLGCLLVAAVACGPATEQNTPVDAGTTVDAGAERVLASLAVSPNSVSLDVGSTKTLTVTGTFEGGASATLTTDLVWTSDTAAVATVSATGVVTAVAPGSAIVKVESAGKSATCAVSVAGQGEQLVIFGDDYATTVAFVGFGGSANEVTVDTAEHHTGTSALKVAVPSAGYTGGALVLDGTRDLSAYDSLTFWVKASKAATLNVSGFGNDTNVLRYSVERINVALTTTWTRQVIPIPLAAKLTAESGLFHFAEGSDEGAYTIWFDDVQYEKLGSGIVAAAVPAISTQAITKEIGSTFPVAGATFNVLVGGVDQGMTMGNAYLTFTSSAPAVATVDADGVVTTIGAGTAVITAKLGETAATGALTVTVIAASAPTTSAPTPTVAAGEVISLFSNAYTNKTVDTWSADWDQADVSDFKIGTDDVKKYSNLVFTGIEFKSAPLDLSGMTSFHLDVWTPDTNRMAIKLVDFGANGVAGGGDDTEDELTFTPSGAPHPPALVTKEWMSFELPLADYAKMTARKHVAQLIIVGSTSTVYLDNVYFHGTGGGTVTPTGPATPAPTPPQSSGNVISLYSNAYTNRTVDTWSAGWDQADVSDEKVGSDDVKKYTALNYCGIEFTSATVDASSMDAFHIDIWTPDATLFKVKLVDFGANGAFGGGDDSEHELTYDAGSTPALAKSQWISLDIPFSAFTGLAHRAHLAQLIMVGSGSTLYVDNVYFWGTPR